MNLVETSLIQNLLASKDIDALPVQRSTLEQLGKDLGAYVLLIDTAAPVSVRSPRHDTLTLAAGIYLYVGSANGPGGIKARLKRHFRSTKKIHWHIDQLTTRAAHIEALAVTGGNECALGRLLTASNRFQIALTGFGSSDCRSCDSHLLVPVQAGRTA